MKIQLGMLAYKAPLFLKITLVFFQKKFVENNFGVVCPSSIYKGCD